MRPYGRFCSRGPCRCAFPLAASADDAAAAVRNARARALRHRRDGPDGRGAGARAGCRARWSPGSRCRSFPRSRASRSSKSWPRRATRSKRARCWPRLATDTLSRAAGAGRGRISARRGGRRPGPEATSTVQRPRCAGPVTALERAQRLRDGGNASQAALDAGHRGRGECQRAGGILGPRRAGGRARPRWRRPRPRAASPLNLDRAQITAPVAG